MPIEYEAGNFLNKEQKKVKQKIKQDCLDGLFLNISRTAHLWKTKLEVFDLVITVLVMFNREVLTHLILNFDLKDEKENIIKIMFDIISDQVNQQIKESLQ